MKIFKDIADYILEIKNFTSSDWLAYICWIGLMSGLLFSVSGFVYIGYINNIPLPEYVWSIPIGTFIFVAAISIDTIGHRTRYKEVLKKGEALLHKITIFCGITSVLALCLAYEHPESMYFPALVLTVLTVLYSIIDEALHWHRYITMNSDPVEMWSHLFIMIGHLLMIFSWWHWFTQGYPGVKEIVQIIKGA